MAKTTSPKNTSANDSLDKSRKAQAESVAETERRMNASRPTPTQDENDRAKLGILEDDLEDDGSGPDPNNQPFTEGNAGAPFNRPTPPASSVGNENTGATGRNRQFETK